VSKTVGEQGLTSPPTQ